MTAVTGRTDTAPAPVSRAHLLEFHAALNEQRRFRCDQLDDLARATRDRSATASDCPRDEVAQALAAGAATALAEIDSALLRIETGRFGICERCGGAIPLERLEILPMAALCMRCQHARDVRAR